MFKKISTFLLASAFAAIKFARHPALLVIFLFFIFEGALLSDARNDWLSPHDTNGYIRNPETGEWRELTDEEAEIIFDMLEL